MRDTKVTLCNGETITGPVWEWRPREGWLTLVGYDEKIYFDELESAITPGQRVGPFVTEDRDELDRAKAEGWVSAS